MLMVILERCSVVIKGGLVTEAVLSLYIMYVLCLNAGISSVLFEARMGCMNEVVPEETQKFIFSVGEMFRLSPIIALFPKSTWPYMPFWKKFVAAWDHLFKVGERH